MSSSEDDDCVWLEPNPERTSFVSKTIFVDGKFFTEKVSEEDDSFHHEIDSLFSKKLNIDPSFLAHIYKQNELLKAQANDEDNIDDANLMVNKQTKPNNVKEEKPSTSQKLMPKKYELFFEKRPNSKKNDRKESSYYQDDENYQSKQKFTLPHVKSQKPEHHQKNYESFKNQSYSDNLLSSHPSNNKNFSKMNDIRNVTCNSTMNKKSSQRNNFTEEDDAVAGPSHQRLNHHKKKHYKRKH